MTLRKMTDEARLGADRQGVSKATRYSWSKGGSKPVFEWIAKTQLAVDDSYQRDLKAAAGMEIARNWDWDKLGALSVVRRADGSLAVTDGQHRLGGAMKREDVKLLPCMVSEYDDVPREARAFLGINTNAKPPTAFDKYKSLIAGGDPVALRTKQVVEAAGYRVARGGNDRHTAGCVAALLRYARRDLPAFEQVFLASATVASGASVPKWLLGGLWAIFMSRRRSGSTEFLPDALIGRLAGLGIDFIASEVRKQQIIVAASGERVWASGILRAHNYRLKKSRRLSLSPDDSDE